MWSKFLFRFFSEQFPVVLDDQMSNTKNLISQLYTDMNVDEYKVG